MKKTIFLFLSLFSFVASGQSLIFGGSTNEAARTKLKGNASNYTINAPTDSTFYLVSTTKYTEIPLSNISSRSLTFTGSNGIAITGGTQTLGANRTWSTRIDSTSSPVITGLRMKGLGTGLVHSNSVGTISSSTLVNADVSSSANIDATKLGTGVVNNTEFNYLDSLTSQVAISIYNIAELKTKIGRYNQKANVLGYYVPNDGGGDVFYWDNTSTATDNAGTIIQVTGVTTGRWIRIYKSPIDIRAFGAKIDGSTNNTTFVQKAIDVDNIYVPSGICKISGTILIPSNRSIKGEFGTTLLGIMTPESAGGFPNQMFINADTTNGNSNISFEKIKFDFAKGSYNYDTGSGLTSINSLKFIKVKQLQFEDCEFFDFVTNYSTGRTGKEILRFSMAMFDSCYNVSLTKIKSSNVREEGLNFYQCKNVKISEWDAEGSTVNTSSHAGFWYCDGVSVKNSTFIHTGGSVINCPSSNVVFENIQVNKGYTQDGRGFDFGNELEAISYNSNNISVNNCYVNVQGYGIQNPSTYMDTKSITIIGNTFKIGVDPSNNMCTGVFIRGGINSEIINNYIYLDSVIVNNTGRCIEILPYSNQEINCNIKGNIMYGNTGIVLYYGSSSIVNTFNIKDNSFLSQGIGSLLSTSGSSTFFYLRNFSGNTTNYYLKNIVINNNIAKNIGGSAIYSTFDYPSSINLYNFTVNNNNFEGISANSARGCSFGGTGVVGNPTLFISNNYFKNLNSFIVADYNYAFISNNFFENATAISDHRIKVYTHNNVLIANDNVFKGTSSSYGDIQEITTGVYNVLQINRNTSIKASDGSLFFSTNLNNNTYNVDNGTMLKIAATSNNTSTVASAIAEITSTTKGLLIPRLTTSQRNAISSPATWLQIICTDCTATDSSTGVLQIYNGSTWKNAY